MSSMRTRWAAIGAAIAVALGAGGTISIVGATVSSGSKPVFVPITACRLFDTRPVFQVGPKSSPLGPNDTHTVTAHGTNGDCTIPTDAVGLSMNVTAVGATLPTFLTIWATGDTRPNASSLNPAPGQPPTPNAVTTDLSTNGRFDVYNLQGSVHVFADVNGYYADHTHDDRYYTQSEVREVAAADVQVTDGLFIDQFTMAPQYSFDLDETVTTERDGYLAVSKYFVGYRLCSPNAGAGRLYYITVDGMGLRSSAVYADTGDQQNVRLQGVTETPVASGEHEIGVGFECLAPNTPGGGGTTFVANASVVVLPAD